ncbi:hypothetical protein [Rhodococcus sp. 114MFTsu3.1]|uniref:hypothetical protein n=1 Tax=Rhodococcus sp. 114MFTsu3.1 TaxID=1172184 RepID=UPI00038187FD|nr:hypothetical protein [Rhodococcus sp. 114MFTsu3.1]
MTPGRLSVVDEIFLRTHRGYGLPIALQGIWRSDDAVDRVDFAAVHANLSLGRLGRRIVSPRVPGARRRWVKAAHSYPLAFEPSPIKTSDILDWADRQADVDLDPEFGPGWRMAVATTDAGGTVISLACSHTLADAAGLVAAAGVAFEGTAPEPAPRRTSDVMDAVSLVRRVAPASVRAAARLAFEKASRRELTHYRQVSRAVTTHEIVCSSATFDIEAVLTNSEFISVVTEIAAELGEPQPIRINVPFRTTGGGTNRIGMATLNLSVTDTVDGIKQATKSAFSRPAGAPGGFPAEVVQLLSDRRAAALTAAPGTARVLCSNIGDIPAAVASIGGHRASSVATRAVHPRAGRARTTTAVSAYVSFLDNRSTLSLVGTEPRYETVLGEVAAQVLARRGLNATPW